MPPGTTLPWQRQGFLIFYTSREIWDSNRSQWYIGSYGTASMIAVVNNGVDICHCWLPGCRFNVVGCFKDVGIVMGKGNGTSDIDVVGRFVVVELWVVGTYVSAFVGLHVPSSSVGLYIGRISLSLDGEGVFGSITSMDQYRLLSTIVRLLGITHWMLEVFHSLQTTRDYSLDYLLEQVHILLQPHHDIRDDLPHSKQLHINLIRCWWHEC